MQLVVSGAVEYKDISFNLKGHKLYQKSRKVLLERRRASQLSPCVMLRLASTFPKFP
jgi:hypothetical protein